jgi:ATP-dependent Clp protease ATP-binding subunit ClpA
MKKPFSMHFFINTPRVLFPEECSETDGEYRDGAIVSAVQLSIRYITDRFLPDKAIDFIDESAAHLRLKMNSKPEVIDNLDWKIQQLEIEREAFKR